jgi:DNA-binding response OmpR family regulator
VVSRAEIAEKVWEITFDTGTNIVDVYINLLRKKVDRDFDQKLIQTRIGLGYTLDSE